MPLTARPAFSGVYSPADASAYLQVADASAYLQAKLANARVPRDLQLTARHIYRWIREGLAGDYLVSSRGEEVALTFLDLISMRLIAVFRAYGLHPNDIRLAHEELQKHRGWAHPFAMEPIWMYGPDLFVREAGVPVSVTKHWQRAFDFIIEYLVPAHHLVFGSDEKPVLWEPSPGVVMDPQVKFGEPCVRGTGIPTEALRALHVAGEPVDRIAWAYDVPIESVEAAIGWERKLEAVKV